MWTWIIKYSAIVTKPLVGKFMDMNTSVCVTVLNRTIIFNIYMNYKQVALVTLYLHVVTLYLHLLHSQRTDACLIHTFATQTHLVWCHSAQHWNRSICDPLSVSQHTQYTPTFSTRGGWIRLLCPLTENVTNFDAGKEMTSHFSLIKVNTAGIYSVA